MTETPLFKQTRLRLAFWYAGVMGIILGGSGLGVYEAIDHAHRVAADRELQAVAGQLHDTLEPILKTQALTQEALDLLPNACAIRQCPTDSTPQHSPGEMFQGRYYIRLIDPTGALVALAGLNPEGLPAPDIANSWDIFRDVNGDRYRQITLPLQHPGAPLWGYLQVGSSLYASDQYLTSVRWAFSLGFPLALLFVGGASWWLSGRAMRPIVQSYQKMQQFTADAAHELRTPLAAAQATVESALGNSDNMPQEHLQVLDRQHQRLSKLVQDLLLLTRLDRETHPNLTPCCLKDIVNDISEELAALAITKRIKFHTDINIEQTLWVEGNEDELYRLVLNLVMNAFQYTPANGTVTLTLGLKNEKAMIQIRDTGIGITPECETKIFDRFFRANSDRSRGSGGSGLGLSIAQVIAHKHRGKITVQSIINHGSTFTIYLPLKAV